MGSSIEARLRAAVPERDAHPLTTRLITDLLLPAVAEEAPERRSAERTSEGALEPHFLGGQPS
jgi:hypothetical protein